MGDFLILRAGPGKHLFLTKCSGLLPRGARDIGNTDTRQSVGAGPFRPAFRKPILGRSSPVAISPARVDIVKVRLA